MSKTMLSIRFNQDAPMIDDRVIVAPPYELVANFIVRDVQSSVAGAKIYIDLLRDVIAGSRPPLEGETGNMWTLDADRSWARLTNDFGHPVLRVELPTPWLLDAIEQWRQSLIARGLPLDV